MPPSPFLSRSILNPALHRSRRFVSRGALSGGFSEESLHRWAQNQWQDFGDPYVDLFASRLTKGCALWLDCHDGPSNELANAFFGSIRFMPERLLLTPFFRLHSRIPDKFKLGAKFLAWTVVVDSPHETILTWQVGPAQGATMVGFDPRLQRVYHGNCVVGQTQSPFFAALVQFHRFYAQFLLEGMVRVLEKRQRH